MTEREGAPAEASAPPAFYRAARFRAERPAARAYTRLQEVVRRADCDLSCYRFLLDRISHLAVLGEPPPAGVLRRIEGVLAAGTPVPLPDDVLRLLSARRVEQIKRGPWVEGHYRPGRPL